MQLSTFTSPLLAIIALASLASAHDGVDHSVPTDPCLTAPSNSTCSSFVFNNATLTTAVSYICAANSFLPGCTLNSVCNADSTLSQTYCAPLTILATLCSATEDVALTNATCTATYNTFCAPNSVIPQCKSQKPFPGLMSGKLTTGTIYSICQEMPMMTGCSICPAPDARGYSICDEEKALSNLCLDMPDMTQCPGFNSMCNATKFTPFCDSKYVWKTSTATTTGSSSTPTAKSDAERVMKMSVGMVAAGLMVVLMM